MLCWCSSCFVGAVLALASGKAERRQLHPLTACLVGALLAWLVHCLLGWCTACLVGALLAWLVQLRQLHPLKVSV